MKTIALRFDVKHIHEVRRKLQIGQPLNEADRHLLKQLILSSETCLYPHSMQMDRYKYNLDQIAKIDPISNPEEYGRLADMIEEFESKFGKR